MKALREAVAANAALRERVDSLHERLEHRRFQLAVLGQFKRGKSTFINALLGAPLLPIAVVPLTAVPVFISWRPSPLVRIRFLDHRPDDELSNDDSDVIRDFLFRFVSEEANPKNQLGIDRVDLFYPAPLLSHGIVLIDTPGVGSTLRHNTEAALRVLPECDAALFVVSVDPPITEVEIEYLQRIKAKTTKLFFVLNKIDYLHPIERSRVADFLQKTLEQNDLWSRDTTVFCVSAQEGLDAKQRDDRSELTSSGIAKIETYLCNDLVAQKSHLLKQAIRGKASDILAEAVAETRLHIRALDLPLDELASKCRSFEETLVSIESQRRTIRDILEGERRRLREQLEERIKLLRDDAKSKLAGIVGSQIEEDWSPQPLSQAITEIFDAARQEFSASFAGIVDSTLKDHQKRISALIDEVRRTAGELFSTPFQTGFEPDSFALGEEPYWVTENIQATLLPDPSGLVDRIVPGRVRARRRRARILRQVEELVLRNAENLRWAILRGIDETFRRASPRFEERFDNAIATTNGIVREALERRRTSTVAVGDELDRLQQRTDLLSDLRKRFCNAMRETEDQAMTDHNMRLRQDTLRNEYRPGVGIVLLNARGEVLVCRRADLKDDAWQMPQGGIDEGETPQEAALRELKEEIGTDKADVIAESGGWFQYDVPPVLTSERWGGRWKGQRQKWVVMLFRGSDSDINLATGDPEFDAWRWVPVSDLPKLAAPFKRQLYLDVIGEFSTVFRD